MNAAVVVFLAVTLLPGASCLLTLAWLWRRRRWQVPPRYSMRSGPAPAAGQPARPKPPWVRDRVIYLAAHLRSCRAVAMAFNRWHGCEMTIGKTCAWELMRRHASEIAELRRSIRRTRAPVIAPGRSWALDLTFLTSPSGATFTALGILDAGSRRLLRLKALPRKCTFTILGHLLLAFAEHGLPSCIRSDNEAMFTSRLWRGTLHALAIVHRRGPPAQPWRNGRIERLFATLKASIGRRWSGTGTALQSALDEFRGFYNVARPHQALGGLTPAEVWNGKSMREVQCALQRAEAEWRFACEGRLIAFHVRE